VLPVPRVECRIRPWADAQAEDTIKAQVIISGDQNGPPAAVVRPGRAGRGAASRRRVTVQPAPGDASTYTLAATYDENAMPGTYLLPAAVVGVPATVLPSIKAARLNVLAAIAHD
jgi:hypothetical protein